MEEVVRQMHQEIDVRLEEYELEERLDESVRETHRRMERQVEEFETRQRERR